MPGGPRRPGLVLAPSPQPTFSMGRGGTPGVLACPPGVATREGQWSGAHQREPRLQATLSSGQMGPTQPVVGEGGLQAWHLSFWLS